MSKPSEQDLLEVRAHNLCYFVSDTERYVASCDFEVRVPEVDGDPGPGPVHTVVKFGCGTTPSAAVRSLAAIMREIQANGLPVATMSMTKQDLVLLTLLEGLARDVPECWDALPPELVARVERLGLVRTFQIESAGDGTNA